jgi:hypothetical protein
VSRSAGVCQCVVACMVMTTTSEVVSPYDGDHGCTTSDVLSCPGLVGLGGGRSFLPIPTNLCPSTGPGQPSPWGFFTPGAPVASSPRAAHVGEQDPSLLLSLGFLPTSCMAGECSPGRPEDRCAALCCMWFASPPVDESVGCQKCPLLCGD